MLRYSVRSTVCLIWLLMFIRLCNEPRAEGASAANLAARVSRLLAQAEKLESAATLCREKVQSGQISDCKVEVTFENNRLVTPAAADLLALSLKNQAHVLSYSAIEQQNSEQNRSAYNLRAQIVYSFEVAEITLYTPSSGATYCNFSRKTFAKQWAPPLTSAISERYFCVAK